MLEIRQTAVFRRWVEKLRDRRAKAMRIHHGPGYRVYFTRRGATVVVLLCGGDKGSQKADIAKAQRLAAELED